MTSQTAGIERGLAFSSRLAQEGFQLRTGLWVVEQLLPPLVIQLCELT